MGAADIRETLARLRELDAKATTGPWKATAAIYIRGPNEDDVTAILRNTPPAPPNADSRLIAEMRNALPELLAAAEAWAKVAEALGAACGICGLAFTTEELRGVKERMIVDLTHAACWDRERGQP